MKHSRLAEEENQDIDLCRDCAISLGETGRKDYAVRILLGLADAGYDSGLEELLRLFHGW